MSGIRALEREDLPQVARLYELIMRSGVEEKTPPHLAAFFEKTLLDQPWADTEIPSLVYADDDGSIVGFVASSVRRMRFDGRPIRLACSGHFLSHPRVRDRAVGALLLRAYLKGPQDITISDGATETVRRMWEGLGGKTAYLRCLSFIKLFRPWRLGADYVLGGRGLQPLESALRPITFGLDHVTSLLSGKWLDTPEPTGTVEPLTPATLLEHLPTVTASVRLHPDYDRRYLEWLFPELDEVAGRGPLWGRGEGRRIMRRGPLWAELVRADGEVAGWYVCNLRPGGFCRILQFAATNRRAETVFRQLAFRAREQGAAGLYGRVEPLLFLPLAASRSLIRVHEGRMLAHSRCRELVDILCTDTAFLTRLDGEWW